MSVELEARRVAKCFGVEEWEEIEVDPDGWVFASHADGRFFYFSPAANSEDYSAVVIEGPWREDDTHPFCEVQFRRYRNVLFSGGDYGGFMARGLYCLGFEDESILSQLPELSAHEKLELRLSFPREFWPQRWREELEA